MKLIPISIIFAIALTLIAGIIIPASAEGEPTVMITDYRVNPSVLMPGSLGTITVTIKNTASSAVMTQNNGMVSPSEFTSTKITDINVNIEHVSLAGNGITVTSQDFDRVGEIGPGQSIPITFSIQAPAQSGMYYPEVRIDTSGGRSTRYPIPVNVNTAIGIQKGAILIAESSLPDVVNPGEEIPVTLTVSNRGETLADDVVVTIENVSAVVAPKTTDLYHLGMIPAGGQQSTQLMLLSDKKASPGLIRIPLTIQYTAIDGTPQTQSTGIDVMLQGKGELGFVSVDTSPRRVAANQPFDLTIRIENTGTGEAKQVAATVDLPMTGTKQSFIGKIKPGNDAPAIFMMDGGSGGTYAYNATLTYVDDLGTHTEVREMSLRVIPQDNTGIIIVIVLVLIGGGFVAYRYWYLPRKNGNGAFPWVKKN
jgi:hypothetical protein